MHIGRIGAAAGVMTLAALITGAGPVQAYDPDPEARSAYVVTPSCSATGELDVDEITDTYCILNDSWDRTLFNRNDSGRALKIQLHKGSAMVGKIEFHPLGEELWVYDTSNDGDTFYVTVCVLADTGQCRNRQGPYRGPVNGSQVVDLAYEEGTNLRFTLWDDDELTDQIETGNAVA
jgi:hypothetical protein